MAKETNLRKKPKKKKPVNVGVDMELEKARRVYNDVKAKIEKQREKSRNVYYAGARFVDPKDSLIRPPFDKIKVRHISPIVQVHLTIDEGDSIVYGLNSRNRLSDKRKISIRGIPSNEALLRLNKTEFEINYDRLMSEDRIISRATPEGEEYLEVSYDEEEDIEETDEISSEEESE